LPVLNQATVSGIEIAVTEESDHPSADLGFLTGGGEMGARMRQLDWFRTPLGPPQLWPQSLKTIVRVMLDSRYAMWMLWGPELTFFCNDAYLPTVGIKGGWVLGARSDKVWEEIWPDIGPRIDRVLAQGQATWDEGLLLFLERSGFPEETYHTFSYSPVYNDESRISGMLCVVTEVTDRVIGERRLRVLRDLAARPLGAESVEESCERLCGVLTQYPLDVPFASLYLIDAATQAARCVARTGAAAAPVLPASLSLADSAWRLPELLRTEIVQEMPDLPSLGIHIPAGPWPDPVNRALLLPLQDAGRKGLAGFLIAGISPRRPLDDAYRSFMMLIAGQTATSIADAQALEAQRQRAEALAEIDRAKTAFFSNVSHEFRTPLTLMLGPVEESIADGRVPREIRERLQLAQRNSVRLLKLVNSLLDFSRFEAGRVQASYEATDLAVLTSDLASTFRSAIERAGLRFQVQCDELGTPVYVDREMWEKIVLNLLSNAFKFTLDGGISIRLRREGTAAVLEVADSGVGIAANELPRLFERFHRIEGTRARTHEGSGIGLALVHELVKMHAAAIEVTSVPGEGTTFRISLPFGTDHLPADRVKAAPHDTLQIRSAQAFVQEALRWLPKAAAEGTTALPSPNDSGTTPPDRRFASTFGSRLIVADDNSDMRAYLHGLLTPAYAVEVVADGAQALAAARRQRPDLILADVMMPQLDGFELVASIRNDEALRSIPIVLLSARAGEEARIEGLDAGADDYLTKPFSARELVTRIGALLELGHMRRRAEAALRRRTAQFETLLNEAPMGVYVIDADFKIIEVNPAARPVFGDMPDLIGRDFDEVVHVLWQKEYADELVRLFRHTLETGESYSAPERIERRLDRDATEYYEWQISRIALPEGRDGAVCYFRDISAHVEARTALEVADRQKDEFLAMLAHELRNPLAPLRNASELLSVIAQQEPRAQFSAGVIRRQVSQLSRLVDDLLDVSRITQGRIDLQRKPLELESIIAQALETVEPLLREKHHEVSIVSGFEHIHVNGDITRLVQCMGNVLANAAKYTNDGGEIRVRSTINGTNALIEISDNGMGISPELLPRIFDLFVQSDRTLDRAQGGLGIGLAVVKRLIEMHGGRVAARSDGIGKGSSFEIRLPLIEQSEIEVPEPDLIETTPRRVLVVDDNSDAADMLALLLQLDGHLVQAVYSSRDALERAHTFQPDIMLLDIGLPEINGYEVAQRLRATPALSDIRLVAVTGYGRSEDRARARAAGFDDHLVKPVEAIELKRVLEVCQR
jgi:PAS domain S-box-containing protein